MLKMSKYNQMVLYKDPISSVILFEEIHCTFPSEN